MNMEEKADWMLLNCTENPNYYDLVYGIYRTMKWWLSPRMMQMKNYTFPIGFYHDVRDNMNLDFFTDGLTPVTYIALLITIARYMFEGLFCKVCLTFVSLLLIDFFNSYSTNLDSISFYCILLVF